MLAALFIINKSKFITNEPSDADKVYPEFLDPDQFFDFNKTIHLQDTNSQEQELLGPIGNNPPDVQIQERSSGNTDNQQDNL